MKSMILFATAYPYATGILAVIWVGSAVLLHLDSSLSFNFVLIVDVLMSVVVAAVGFRN